MPSFPEWAGQQLQKNPNETEEKQPDYHQASLGKGFFGSDLRMFDGDMAPFFGGTTKDRELIL